MLSSNLLALSLRQTSIWLPWFKKSVWLIIKAVGESRVPVSHPCPARKLRVPGANIKSLHYFNMWKLELPMIWDLPYSCRNYLANHRAPYFVSLWWSRYLWLHYCVVDIECDESRLGILLFFSLPPFCLFCYHCSLSLYFAKCSCTFRSSVLFCFASLPLFLQFIGKFLFMCRVCCETQFVWANYQLCIPTYYFTYYFISLVTLLRSRYRVRWKPFRDPSVLFFAPFLPILLSL